MDYTLPPTTYQARPARGTILNTIIEEGHTKSDSSDTDEGTIIGRPAGLDEKLFVAVPRDKRPEPQRHTSPISESVARDWRTRPPDFDDMYDVSDDETEFSDSCPSLRDSLSSRPTSFGTDATRYSTASNRSSRNRYPSLSIPSTSSLPSHSSPLKSASMPPTPPPKIPVSPAILSLLPSFVLASDTPPSLDGSSTTSEQVANISAPVTPDMQNILGNGDQWGRGPVRLHMDPDSTQEPTIPEEEVESEVSIVIEHEDDLRSTLDSFPVVFQEMQSISRTVEPPNRKETCTPSDDGVQLPTNALDLLNTLVSGELSSTRSDSPVSNHSAHEMKEVSNPPSRPGSAEGKTPASAVSDYSFSSLSIPSPGGFFSSLNAGAQNPWAPGSPAQEPTSAVAERFYNLPWEPVSENVMEQIVEVDETATTDGPPTARQSAFPTASPVDRHSSSTDADTIQETGRKAVAYEYDESYETELLQTATAHLDRTSIWLAAQSSYLAILKGTDDDQEQPAQQEAQLTKVDTRDSTIESAPKKVVSFAAEPTTKTENTLETTRRDSIFYRGFQYVADERSRKDSFLHQSARYDAIQSARTAIIQSHIDMLLGKFEITEPWRPAYSGPFSQNPRQTGVFELTPAQTAFMKVEREKQALERLAPASWHVDAIKFLNGGNLLTSPASRRLAKANIPLTDPRCVGKARLRVLDFGGQGSCDWAWHCADQYKNVKIYTVATKQQVINFEVNGPANHRIVSVPHLWQLPFRNGHFDVISARSLQTILRSEPDVTGTTSELDMCLKECLRVLKPAGYLEFSLIDASIARAGPLASAMSVEFGFNLRTRGYDPEATRLFSSRLRRAGFVNTKNAWLFLPVGAPTPEHEVLRETPFPQNPSVTDLAKYEAVRGPLGSTANAANIAGLVGGWQWESWMLKLQMEMGKEKEKWLEGVGEVVEEGRNGGAGYKMLTGWTQKPWKRRRGQHGVVKGQKVVGNMF